MSRTLIHGCDVVTLDAESTVLHDTSVLVEDGRIRAVGEAPAEAAPDHRLDARGKVLLPALFNAHCHSPMTFERGWAEDLPLDRWFNERIWVAESALTEADVRLGAELAACEMIRAGVVGFHDHYFHMDHVAEVAEMSGMKASLAWCVFGQGREKEVGADLAGTLAFIERWQGGAGGRIRTVLGPHSSYACPPAFLREVAAAARDRELPVHLHTNESPEQVEQSRARHGHPPVIHLANCGLLDGPTVLAHCLHLAPEEVALLAERDCVVARTPVTYMKLAMGPGDVGPLLDAGITLALGTDGPGSNNDMDMLHVARTFSLLQKHVSGDAEAVAGDLPLRLATRNAARACGFPESGVIAPGAPADLVLVDTRRPHLRPRHDLVANLVHCAHAGDVTDVMCDGRWLLSDGELTTLDEARILHEAEGAARAMVRRNMRAVREYEA